MLFLVIPIDKPLLARYNFFVIVDGEFLMYNQDFKQTVVLCLDVDNMLINPQTSPERTGVYDINGENTLIYAPNHNIRLQPTRWYTFLEKLQQICTSKGAELNVQIISAKMSGDADSTIDAIVTILYPFLKPMNTETKKLYDDTMPNQYLYQVHGYKNIENKRKNNMYTSTNPTGSGFSEDDFALPSIHIVLHNSHSGITSKVKVMKHIEYELREAGKNPILMALVDDNPVWGYEMTGDTSWYKFINETSLGLVEGKSGSYYKFFDAELLVDKTVASPGYHPMRKHFTERIWDEIEYTIRQVINSPSPASSSSLSY